MTPEKMHSFGADEKLVDFESGKKKRNRFIKSVDCLIFMLFGHFGLFSLKDHLVL